MLGINQTVIIAVSFLIAVIFWLFLWAGVKSKVQFSLEQAKQAKYEVATKSRCSFLCPRLYRIGHRLPGFVRYSL
jgi:hypothetical protein